jgi:NADP-dependent 3-hydroxy acid dehydrogenase YdfG
MPLQDSDVWFITGCSTGFGRELAKLVLDRGYRAVVTARDPRKIQDLTTGHEGRVLVLKLDVTNAAEAADAVKKAETTFGSIDVLVNNAGYGYVGAVEES